MKIDTLDMSLDVGIAIKDYINLKKQEKLVKDQLAVISPEVTTWLEQTIDLDAKDKTVELPTGDKLTLVVGKNWQYPKYVEDEVKALKAKQTEIQKIYQIKNPGKWEPSTTVRFKDGGDK